MSIKNLPESERPYEKYLKHGMAALTDADLLAVILRSGTKDRNSTELARCILSGCSGNLLNLYDLTYQDLMKFDGIGKVKAIQLKAVAELSVRIAAAKRQESVNLQNSESVAQYFMEQMRHLQEEHVICAYFDARCKLLGDETVFIGANSQCILAPKVIFDHVMERHAAFFILLHNHPSGDPYPSQEDISITGQIQKGALILGLSFLDHIIIGDNCYFSFRDEKMLS